MSEVIELLQQLIRNQCVNDGTPESGHEYRSVETIADFLGQPGRVFEPVPGRQSVVYRVPGRDPAAPALLLMGHTDVVPVSPQGWTIDPFGAERKDGYVWGRGAVDMLNVTAAMASVFLRYLREQAAPLAGDLVFLAVADEEAGGTYGAAHIFEEEPEAVIAEFVLTEVAFPNFDTPGGPGLVVTVAEKGPQWRRLITSGSPGHGSQPLRASNAMVPLAEVVTRLGSDLGPVAITDEWRRFVSIAGLDEALVDPDRVDDAIADIDDVGIARWVHACTHLTLTPTVIAGGTKTNVVPDSASVEIDIRALPGQERADVDDHFRKVLGPDLFEQVEMEDLLVHTASSSQPSGLLWDSLDDARGAVGPPGPLLPAIFPGSTDGRFWRERGSAVYGAGLFDPDTSVGEMLSMFHGNDERVSEVSVDLTTDFLAATVEAFGARTASL
ncbi:MAG: M20/M25/M40 family metallo-hydrolase [Acidimicrobiia bacterium]|nr:M20/M25/M40 family metallo-hydrolase [Acidimicrobiia bacterium]